VPEKFKTTEMCLEALKQHGWVLEYVPKKLKTLELCLEAVKKYRRALQYVPEEMLDEVRYRLAKEE